MNEIASDNASQQAAEIAALRLENKALSGQVMRLIKAESKLYAYQEQLDVQLKEYKELYELNRKLNATFELRTIFEYAIEYIINTLGYERVLFLKQFEDTGDYVVSAMGGYYDQQQKSAVAEFAVTREDLFLSPLFEGGEYLICTADSDQTEFAEHRARMRVNEFLLYPLGSHAHPVAILAVGNSAENAEFYRRVRDNNDELLGIGNLAGLLSSTIQNQISYANMKRALEQEILAEAKYRGIFENSIEGIFQSSPDGKIINCNPATAAILGYSTPEQVIESISDIGQQHYVNPQQRGELLEMMHNGLVVRDFEVEFFKHDGSRQWMCLNSRPFFNERGELLHLDGNIQDITERKNLEKQLQHSLKMDAIGTLAGGIAHDFNNLLTAIIGFGTLLEMQMFPDDPLRKYASNILSAADRAANLTKSLLTFSREQPLDSKIVDLNDVIHGVKKLLPQVLREDIECRILLTEEALTIFADPGQIGQILLNLAINARDAMSNGGELTISTMLMDMDQQFIKAHGCGAIGHYAVLSVTDTGLGMDEATRQRIFEPFFTTKEVGKGTGLGLSMVFGIIKQHHGFVTCYSEPGIGTTFNIYLPLHQANCSQEKMQDTILPAGGTETILLAEDDEIVRDLTRTVLEGAGYRVIEAVNGRNAVQQYMDHRNEVDLLIFDLIMPKMNGRDAYSEIREVNPHIRIIFTSGYAADVAHSQELSEYGFDFIAKPARSAALLKKVREVLDRS